MDVTRKAQLLVSAMIQETVIVKRAMQEVNVTPVPMVITCIMAPALVSYTIAYKNCHLLLIIVKPRLKIYISQRDVKFLYPMNVLITVNIIL